MMRIYAGVFSSLFVRGQGHLHAQARVFRIFARRFPFSPTPLFSSSSNTRCIRERSRAVRRPLRLLAMKRHLPRGAPPFSDHLRPDAGKRENGDDAV